MGQLLFGTTLLAPCCVSVMLPAYLASGFRRRSGIVAGTLVFAAGIGTVIVPIGLGASAISAALSANHLLVFSIGGIAMAVGGLAMLAGWKPRLPMPSAGPAGRGVTATYGLGVFSGVASACCAPVLAGVAVLSGASQSFLAALTIGLVYVAGMVAPLLALALVWDRRDWASSRLLHGRDVRLRIGGFRRRLALGSLFSGLLLVGMGALTIVIAFTGPAMTSGWRQRLAAAAVGRPAAPRLGGDPRPGVAARLGVPGAAGCRGRLSDLARPAVDGYPRRRRNRTCIFLLR